MKRRSIIAGSAVLAAVLAVSAFTREQPGADAARVGEDAAPRVRVEQVSTAPPHTTVEFSARVQPADRSTVGFTLGGRVEQVHVSVGDAVAAGEVLATLDRRPFEHALAEARAGLSEVSSSLAQAERELRRARALGDATTPQELEQRRTAVRRLEARREQARAAVAEAERRLSETELTAPYAAQVVRRFSVRGEVVSGGAPVVALSSAEGSFELELALPEHVFSAMTGAQTVEIGFPLSPAVASVRGVIAARSEHAGGDTGLFEVTVHIPAEAAVRGVRPGMMARAAVPQRVAADTVAVSPAALTAAADGSPVVYSTDEGVVSERPVELRGLHQNQVLISGDVAPGDAVVVSGHYALLDGDRVKVSR